MQSFYRFNIMRRAGDDWQGKPRFLHYCNVDKPQADFATLESVQAMADDLRKAFATLGEFRVEVTAWNCHGTTLAV